MGEYPLYVASRHLSASPAFNEFSVTSGSVLWFNPATYYGNDPYTNYLPIINFGTGFTKHNWNDTVLIPYTDTANHVVQLGLIRCTTQDNVTKCDTLYANSTLQQRPHQVYTQSQSGTQTPLPTLAPTNISQYMNGGKLCGIPHEQPVAFDGYKGVNYTNKGYFTVSYGFDGGARRTELKRPIILVDGVDFGTRRQAGGWNDRLNQCGTQGYYSFKHGLDVFYKKSDVLKKNEFFDVGIDRYTDYPFAYRNMPQFIDSINNAGYDFIFLDFAFGADDMRNNSAVLRKLIDMVNSQACNSVANNCARNIDELIVCGASMGGQVARHALTYMEHNNMPHHTKQYVAFDSPHLGANVPIGLQAVAGNIGFHNLIGQLSTHDMVIRKFMAPASKQLLLMHYPRLANTILHKPATGNEDIMRTVFYAELAAMGNWPNQCEKIAVANGSSDGTTLATIQYGDPILDIRLEYNQMFSKADAAAEKQCTKAKKTKGWNKVGQGFKCAGAHIKKNFISVWNFVRLFGAPLLTMNFNATAYCPDGTANCKIAKVDPVFPTWRKRIKLTNARTVLDNAPGSGNDGLASAVTSFGAGVTLVTSPSFFFTFIPTTSALALNTRNVPNFQNIDFNGNETDVVNQHILFDWTEFNKKHSSKTVFDRVFFNGNVNEQHVEVTYDASNNKLSKITQFLHVARTSKPYVFVPVLRTLGYATGTNVLHYNFDTLVTETGYRKSTIDNNVQAPVGLGTHIINKNGYLGINEYAPAGLFDTKASNSYVYANLPINTPVNKGNANLQKRNWHNQQYKVYGCSYITINANGKMVVGDKDSVTRYTANTTIKEQARVTLNTGGDLIINDNSTLTFEKDSYFNYNGGSITLNGPNARIVFNAGANVILAPSTTFTVKGGSKGLGKIVFNGSTANQYVTITNNGQNKLKLKGKGINQTLVEVNNCIVQIDADSSDMQTMQVSFTGTPAQLILRRTAFTAVQTNLVGGVSGSAIPCRGLEIQEHTYASLDRCKANNLLNGIAIFGNPKVGLVTTKVAKATITNCVYGIYQNHGGINVSNSTITNTEEGILLQITELNNQFSGNTIKSVANINAGANGVFCNGTTSVINTFENNVVDGFGTGVNIQGANKLVLSCNTIKNSIIGVYCNYVGQIIAQANLNNHTSYSGYNKFSNNTYHLQFQYVTDLLLDEGYNTFGVVPKGGKVIKGLLDTKAYIVLANYNKWSVATGAGASVFQNQFDVRQQNNQTTILQITDANRQSASATCGSHNANNCGNACRLACVNCTPITTANFASVASNIAVDSVMSAMDTTRTNTNYVAMASQGSQVLNYNYPSTSTAREKQLVRQAHKYQQLAHAMAVSSAQLTPSSNYTTATTTTLLADIESVLANAKVANDSHTVASQHLSKVQALYVAQQYTQALSYVTSIKPSIHAGWLAHLNYWECVVQNAYALSTNAITMEQYASNISLCDGGAGTHRMAHTSQNVDAQGSAIAQETDIENYTNLSIHPNPVAAGTTLSVSGEAVTKLVLYNAHGVKCIEYTNENLLPTLAFIAPSVAGMYWLEVHYANSASQRYKVVVN